LKGKTYLSTPHSAVSKNHHYNSDLFKVKQSENSKKNHLSHRYMKPLAPQEYSKDGSKKKNNANSRL
jgi:phage antirepressor YoqD-like protein